MSLIGRIGLRIASHTLKGPACGATACALTSENHLQNVRFYNIYKQFQPKPGLNQNLRFEVVYPENREYTVKPLPTKKLAGRDPETGRIINGALGGGAKRNYRMIDWKRQGPTDGTFLEERVLGILYDPNRTANIALVGSGDRLRYLIATHGMKKGDLIRTSSYIPRIPVRPKDGDAYPLGALPMGTSVCCVSLLPGDGARIVKAAGTCAIVKRKFDEKIVIQIPSKREYALAPECMATVGRVSNIDHDKEHIGSAQRNRWLGNRPRSGLWQRKTGYHGRKIRALPPINIYEKKRDKTPLMVLTLTGEGHPTKVIPSTDRVS